MFHIPAIPLTLILERLHPIPGIEAPV